MCIILCKYCLHVFRNAVEYVRDGVCVCVHMNVFVYVCVHWSYELYGRVWLRHLNHSITVMLLAER